MMIAGTGGSHRDGTRPYPHFSLHTRRTFGGQRHDMQSLPCKDAGGFGHRKSGGSHRNPEGSYSYRKKR